jgi:hypothetical protein
MEPVPGMIACAYAIGAIVVVRRVKHYGTVLGPPAKPPGEMTDSNRTK